MREPKQDADRETAMGMATFRSLLEQYGAAPDRWPAEWRGPAQALLASTREAHAALRQAAALDGLLDMAPRPDTGADRVARVVAGALADLPARQPVRRPPPFAQRLRRWVDTLAPVWPRTAGLAACTAAGILVGTVTPATGPAPAVTAVTATAGNDLAGALFTPSALESLFQ
ncbi:hypothetical protein [Niveispirillum fermenti]|uniref:hypothetical protein n=1 Tax=Niveispirillum fermenti TaxID=1233113 RepID=UPI003A85053A